MKAHDGSGQRHNQAADHQEWFSGEVRQVPRVRTKQICETAFYDSCRRLTTRRLGQQRGAAPPETPKTAPVPGGFGYKAHRSTEPLSMPRTRFPRPSPVRRRPACARAKQIALERNQSNYLGNVLRLAAGETILVFNGRDGEWQAAIDGRKRPDHLSITAQTRPQDRPARYRLCLCTAETRAPRLHGAEGGRDGRLDACGRC